MGSKSPLGQSREDTMLHRSSIGALAIASALLMPLAGAKALDDSKYPDFNGQWRRPPGIANQFDISKPQGPAQQVPLTGAVIVSTPQDIALIDARRGIAMFEKVNIPLLGLIENMSSFCCPTCQHVTPIFGHGGARLEAETRGIPYLGEIPLDIQIRQTSDDGRPIVAIEPDGVHAKHYIGMAREIWTTIVTGAAHRPPPRIVIE